MDESRTLTTADGRTVGFVDFGPEDGVPVIDCHGGPGSRFEPRARADDARGAGIRFVGIDRPGYGLSTPRPGRAIVDWVPDALAVADALGIEQFAAVGSSTGASYALAVAATAPERVSAALVCCGITDMRWEPAMQRAKAVGGQMYDIWQSSDRDAAIAIAREYWGDDGLRVATRGPDPNAVPLAAADVALLSDPATLTSMLSDLKHSFAFGVEGYTDDRIADGVGWGSFDLGRITCPVLILHGEADTIVDVSWARHTHELLPQSELRVVPGLGHFSIGVEIVPALKDLLRAVA